MKHFDLEFVSSDGAHVAQGWKTDDAVVPSLGYGGHPVGARPKRKALTVYEGRQPFNLSVPMLLFRGISENSKGQNESVEKDRKALEAMATRPGEVEEVNPPGVIFSANFPLPIPPSIANGIEWWIEDLGWGEEKRNPSTFQVDPGHLTWKLVTVTLLEKVEDQLLGFKPPTVRTTRARRYKVKKGDTLHSIAGHQLGNANLWKKVAELNHIRSDGQLRQKVGKYINLPAVSHKAKPVPPKKKATRQRRRK